MLSKMLKHATFLFVLTALLVTSGTILLSDIENDQTEDEFHKHMKCDEDRMESSVVPVTDDVTNESKGCDQYGVEECDKEGSTGEYEVVEADGCTVAAELDSKLYYWLCHVEIRTIPHGTVDCAWQLTATESDDPIYTCKPDGEFSNTNTRIKDKCSHKLMGG